MRYSLCKDVGISENGGTYLTYGIKVFCKEGVKLIEDVSTDYYFVKSIVDRFTKFKLDPVHIYDCLLYTSRAVHRVRQVPKVLREE